MLQPNRNRQIKACLPRTCNLAQVSKTFISNNAVLASSKALSTPAVRHMAKKNGLDINEVAGTGKGGRVTKEDLINFMSGKT